MQIPAFQAAGLEIVAVAGRNAEKTALIAKEHNIALATTNWQELLDLDCELISVTTPPMLHKEQAIAVLEAGKHLLCEKPLALNLQEAQEMLAVANKRPEQLALVDHELRFTPVRLKAKELLQAGAIGRILALSARVATDLRIDAAKPWNWWSAAEQGGGILGAIGSHVLDGIRWLLGDIHVRGATFGKTHALRQDEEGKPREVTAEDIVSATFSVGDAVGTMLVHGASLDEPIDMLKIRGDEGTLVIDRSSKLYLGKGRGPLKEYVTQLPGIVPNRFRSNPYAAGTVLLGQALADALEHSSADPLEQAASLRDGMAVQELMDEIRRLANT